MLIVGACLPSVVGAKLVVFMSGIVDGLLVTVHFGRL